MTHTQKNIPHIPLGLGKVRFESGSAEARRRARLRRAYSTSQGEADDSNEGSTAFQTHWLVFCSCKGLVS